jgi:hypothetical protein
MPGMNREPGESAEQWNARAAAKYQQALEAVEIESRRLGLDGWRFPPGTYPMLDAAYDRAMDDLDATDDERTDAATALRREGPATDKGQADSE